MLRVDQAAIVHTTNYNLVNIRNAEINYFSNFFTNFGTQCALIAGFLSASISQVPGLDASCHISFKYFYWLTTAIAFVSAMQVLVCTVFIAVYGQGFALRGPIGSMIKAINGMVIEQQQVVISFIITVIFFCISTVATYWIMMEPTGALISSIISIVGVYFWYHYSLRIYNRFKWKKSTETAWTENSEDETDPAKALTYLQKQQLQQQRQGNSSNSNSDMNNSFFGSPSSKEGGNMKDRILGNNKSSSSDYEEFSENKKKWKLFSNPFKKHSNLEESFRPKESYIVNAEVTHAGYISTDATSSSVFKSENWQRRYVIVQNSLVFFYSDKNSYDKSPDRALKKRPTDLEGYRINMSTSSAPFIIQLIPSDPEDDRKIIQFACDTQNEAQLWIEVFLKAIKYAKQTGISSNNINNSSNNNNGINRDVAVTNGIVGVSMNSPMSGKF